MNKIRLLFKYLFLLLLFVILFGCGNSSEKQKKDVKSISLTCLPTKLDYISSEQLMLDDGEITVFYDNNTTEIINITSNMYDSSLPSSIGENTVNVIYYFEDKEFSTTIKYYLHPSEKTREFVIQAKSLPFLNEITIEDSKQIIECYEQYEALSNEERYYIDSNFSTYLEKNRHLQNYIMPTYNQYIKNKAIQDFNLINKGAYSSDNYQKIENYVTDFQNKTFYTLIEANTALDDLNKSISKIEKNIQDLNQYKINTINTLKSLLCGETYVIDSNKKLNSEKNNYYEKEEYRNILNGYFESIEKAKDIETIDSLYIDIYPKIESIFMCSYPKDCLISIQNIYNSLIEMEGELIKKYSKDSISINGLFDNINIDFIDDNRWWIPKPYKLCTIMEEVDSVLHDSKNIYEIENNYQILCDELIRSTLQKNIEIFYSINRNLNKGYDSSDVYYWNNIGSYWSSSVSTQFVYDGILKKYVGEIYGSSNENSFRLSHFFYGPLKEKSIYNLINRYYELKNIIAPLPLKISNIIVSELPTQTEYNINDTIDLSGGKIYIEYNDLSIRDIDIDDSFIYNSIDMSTIGSKEVQIRYVDSKTNEEKILSFYINVLSNTETYYNEIIIKINSLNENSNIDDINDIYSLLYSLDEEKQNTFKIQYEKQYNTLLFYEETLMESYTFERLNERTIKYETINYYNLSDENQRNLDTAFNELLSQITNAKSFVSADSIFDSYDNKISSITYINNELDLYKINTIKSIDRICEISFYDITGTLSSVGVNLNTYSLKNIEKINAVYIDVCNQINSKANINDVNNVYNNLVPRLYEDILSEYANQATENVKSVVNNTRNTVKEIWINKTSCDLISINGEAGSTFSSDYNDDSGYYSWYTPEAFRVKNVKAKITVGVFTNKHLIAEQYNKAFYEMFRAACYRNLFTVFFFNTQYNIPMKGGMWSTLYFCDPGFYYDGTIEEYENQYFESKSFRLWRWGWHDTEKCNNIDDLLYHYNFDLNLFITN